MTPIKKFEWGFSPKCWGFGLWIDLDFARASISIGPAFLELNWKASWTGY